MASKQFTRFGLLFAIALFSLVILQPSLQLRINKNEELQQTGRPKSGYLEVDGHNYYVGTDGDVNWFDAQSLCGGMNMSLVSLQDKAKNDAIQSALAFSTEYKDFWLWNSGFRVMYSSNWYWGSTGELMGYTNWGSNEPDVVNQSSSCVNFKGSYGSWQDDDCDFYVMYFMCE